MAESDEKHGTDYSARVDYIKLRRIIREEVREAIGDLIKVWGTTLEQIQDTKVKNP